MKSFTNYVSGIRLPECSKLALNWKIGNDVNENFFLKGLTRNPEIKNTPV